MKRYQFSEQEKAILEGLKQPFAVYQFVDKRVVTLVLSDGFCDLFGYADREQAYMDMDNNMYKNAHPDDAARIAEAAIRFATVGGKYEVIYRTKTKDGPGYVVVHAKGEHVITETGERLAQVWYTDEGKYAENSAAAGFEITKTLSNALHEQSILKASQYDYLTGLPSMAHFFELAETGKTAILETGGLPVLLYMDFYGMKFFNSKYGFAQGDKILQSFSQILSKNFGRENCCRIGADHFAVIAEEADLEEKLYGIFQEFGQLQEGQTPPVHVGIYPHRLESVPISTACDRAKFACTTLQGTYSSAFSYYSEELREEMVHKQYVRENFDTALREGWIQVYYQPIIRALNEKVCDEEALARWIDPTKGFMSPAQFIPALEEAGLIYKLDLYVLERVLEKIQIQKAEGLYIVPHSINLSRSDFDACDIVEEIRRRVDAAGVARNRITIEITESTVGRDFDFMKKQIARFQSLGFPVWMDDFGSGYSSLDVLQSIQFELLKFDMNFTRRLNEGESGRIILTELVKMATALGVDTVCEGVETEEQARFLQEIGCSKLQGYYYQKPISLEHVLNWHRQHQENGFENPEESAHFDTIGRVNLYDLDVIAHEEEGPLRHTFNTLPMGIIEIKGDCARFLRSNQAYRDFIKRFFAFDLSVLGTDFSPYDAAFMYNVVKNCCGLGVRAFYDEKMPDGSVVHSFARRISEDPVTGNVAVAVAVLSVTEPDETTSYADIARALAADFYNIYVVDLDTDRYIEYSSPVGGEELAMERHGTDFFEVARRDAMTRIYPEDRGLFLTWFSKNAIMRELDRHGVFATTYRLIDTGKPVYVNMKITRMQPDGNRIILGISLVEAQMKQKELFEEMQKERDTLVRMMALSDGYLSLFTVDPVTGSYTEYSSTDDFDSLGAAKQGDDFFKQAIIDARKYLHPEDQEDFIRLFTRENMMPQIREHGSFRIRYRLMINGKPRPVALKAALFIEKEEEKLVIGVRARRNRQNCTSKGGRRL